MKKRMFVEIKPELLRNLREIFGFSKEQVAKKLQTSQTKIEQIEKGELPLTLSQLKKLAKLYRVSLALFFSESLPKLPTVPDYRLNRERKLNPEVFIAQKKAYYLARELYSLTERTSTIPYHLHQLDAIQLAKSFRKILDIELIKNKPAKEILQKYKSCIEEKMFVPVIEHPLKAEDVRAFSIHGDVCIIVLNEEDAPEVKLFSLFHEVAHLLKKTGALCSIDLEIESTEVETFCNHFAAEFLVPADDLREEISKRKLEHFDQAAVSELAGVYGVSKQVIMLRLLWLNYISRETYAEFKRRYEQLEKAAEHKKGFARRNWTEVFFNRAGGLIITEMKKAYKRGDITLSDVISSLEIKAKYAEKFVEG
ncbi:MAG TPA: ImmA/IrrE family metallo-endopeptidase [Deltaproteobacteria bacterium]|nr:ImmA/IrrE family metallo-endopeptidase [Deltaproteobacteria bacterium]